MTLYLEDGTAYANPYSDLHTLSSKGCVAPHLFEGKPEWEWRKIADKSGSRKAAKGLNFGHRATSSSNAS